MMIDKGTDGTATKDREERYMEIARNSVTYADWGRVWKKAAQQAVKGDAVARKFLADYLIGPPTQTHDVKSTGEVKIKVVYGDGSYRKPEKS